MICVNFCLVSFRLNVTVIKSKYQQLDYRIIWLHELHLISAALHPRVELNQMEMIRVILNINDDQCS